MSLNWYGAWRLVLLQIHLFGLPRLFWLDRPLPLSAPPKTLPLLAYLLLNRERPIKRAALAFTLWLDVPEKDALANLRRHMHYMRKWLPAAESAWLCTDGDLVQWNPKAAYWLDVAEFERLSADANAATLERAIALYRGDLLADVYDDWIYPDRERLRELYLADLCQLIHLRRLDRDYPQAIAFAHQALACDPLREDVVRQLISLRYESGDRAGALDEFKQFAEQLRGTLGVEPMPETRALHETIRRNARLAGPGRAAADESAERAASQAPTFTLPFAGRAAEMERLSSAWKQAASGTGRAVLICGEAGVGKTRLAQELAWLVEKQGGRVLFGNTWPGEPRPYQAVVEALESVVPLVSAIDLSPIWRAALSTLVPCLAAPHPAPLLPTLEPERERDRLFEALTLCFQRLAEPRPLLLVLEDLHWAGEASLALFEWLARRAARHSILILATYRGEEVDRNHPLRRLRRNLEWDRSGEHLSLDRLSAEAVADLLSRVIEFQSASSDVIQWLRDKSDGNPLFIEFFVQHWLASRADCPSPADDPIAIPIGIQALITRRLECLSDQARTLSEIASVVGVTFDVETVGQVCGWEEHQALSTLSELLDRRLVREAGARGEGPFEFVFSHHLIQSVIYAGIPERRLRRWHLRVGQAMEGLYGDCPSNPSAGLGQGLAGELGRHFALGGDVQRAVPCLLTAARQALTLYADEQALRVISQAVALLDEAQGFGDSITHLHWLWESLALREEVEHRHGHRQAQQSDLEQMERIAEQVVHCSPAVELRAGRSRERNEELSFECLRRWARYWHVTGQRQQEEQVCQVLLRRTQETGELRWQAEALRANATLQIALGQVSGIILQSDLEQAVELYRHAGQVAGQVSCLCLLTDAAVQQGHFQEAQAQLEQARLLAQVDGDYSLLVQTLRAASGAWFAQQDFSKSQQTATQMLELCRTIGDREGEADSLARLGTVSARLFAIQAAREYYAQARALYADLGKRQGQAGVLVNTGVLATRLGHYAEGQLAFEQAGELFQILEDVRGQAVCALNLCMAAYFQGEFVIARGAAARGLELARQMSSQVMEANALANLGAAERELGQLPGAIAHMEAGLAIRRTLGQVAELGTDLCDLVIAYVRQGSLEAAQRSVVEMLDIYSQHEQAMMHPQYILWAAAQTFRAAGEQARAREYLERACAVMQGRARAIPNDDSRASFLELPFNREIRLACEQGVWPV